MDSEAAFKRFAKPLPRPSTWRCTRLCWPRQAWFQKRRPGKRRRTACRDLFLQEELEAHACWTAEVSNGHFRPLEVGGTVPVRTAKEIEAWLVQRIAARLSLTPSQIQVTQPFLEMGMGSLDAMEITSDLQKWLDRPLSPTAIYNHPSTSALACWLARPVQVSKSPHSKAAVPPPETDFDSDHLLKDVQQLSEAEMVAFIERENDQVAVSEPEKCIAATRCGAVCSASWPSTWQAHVDRSLRDRNSCLGETRPRGISGRVAAGRCRRRPHVAELARVRTPRGKSPNSMRIRLRRICAIRDHGPQAGLYRSRLAVTRSRTRKSSDAPQQISEFYANSATADLCHPQPRAV